MLCECVPIVSNVNSLPSIVRNSGFILEKRDLKMLFDLINNALKADYLKLEKLARERIINNFAINNRKSQLINELEL